MCPQSPDPLNPFPGLRPFRSDEKHLFFGREDQVGELLERLRQSRFLAVVGPSGSGKSSLVRAGLLPELHGGTMATAGSHWEVVIARPGVDPLTNLAAALVEAELYDPEETGIVDQVRTTLDRSGLGLVEAVRQSDVEDGVNTLVVIDQFEEIFRFRSQLGQSLEEATAFVKLLIEASRQDEQRIYVVLTMRSDYLGDCGEFRGLAEVVNSGEYLIPRLTRAQRRSAISGPVQVGGAEISKRLLTKLLNDVGDDPDQLPVLQHALMRTWSYWASDHQSDESVDLRHYEATGGMQEALSRHADEVFESLGDPRKQQLAEKMFRALTERVDESRGIRRPLRYGHLAEVAGTSVEELAEVVDAFRAPGCTFLMPPASIELTPRRVVDISHESLMRTWQRLRSWVETEAQSASIYRRLDETARLQASGRAGLYHDPDLQIALSWREESQPNEAWASLYGGDFANAFEFLDKSQEQASRAEKEREAARQRELEQAKALAESQARSARLMRRFAITVCGALIVAVGLAAWALHASKIAEQATIEARAEQGKTWLANARALRDAKDFFGAKLKASRARGFDGFGRERLSGELQERYHVLLTPDLPEWTESGTLVSGTPGFVPVWQSGSQPQHVWMVNDACVSPLGTIAVTAGENELVLRVWDLETGAELPSVSGHEDDVEALAFSPDGSVLASAEHRTIILWRVEGQNSSGKVGFNEWQQRVFDSNDFRALEFSPDGQRLVAGDTVGQIFVWDLASNEADDMADPLHVYHEGQRISDLEFSPDGSLLASSAWDGKVLLLSGVTLELEGTLESPELQPPANSGRSARVYSISFSPDGERLTVAGERLPVTVWNVATREPVVTLLDEEFLQLAKSTSGNFRTGNTSFRSNVAYSPDGTGLVIAWDEHSDQYDVPVRPTLTVFDVTAEKRDRPERLRDLTGHADTILGLRFAPDNRRVLAFDEDGTSWLWDTARGTPVGGEPATHSSAIHSLAFSRDGRRFASGDRNGVIRVWDASSGQLVSTLRGHPGQIDDLCFSLDGGRLFSVGRRDRTFRAWNIATSENVHTAEYDFVVRSVDLSPDGSTVIVGGWHEALFLYDAQTLSETRRVATETGTNHVRFLPGGSRVVLVHNSSAGGPHSLYIYELGDGDTATKLGYGGDLSHEGWIRTVVPSPDGTRLVSCAQDASIKFWRVSADGSLTEDSGPRFPQHEDVRWVELSSDGTRVVTADGTGSVRIWNVLDGELVALLAHPGAVSRVTFSPDDRYLLTGGAGGVLQLWAAQDDRIRHTLADLPGAPGAQWFDAGPRAVHFERGTGNLLVAGGLPDEPSAIVTWDVSGRAPIRIREFIAGGDVPKALAESPDGRWLASGGSNVLLWHLRTGERRVVVENAEDDECRSLAFSPDGATLVSGHSQGNARFWSMEDVGAEVRKPIPHSSPLLGIAFTPDGTRLITGGGPAITLWSFDPRTKDVARVGSLVGHASRVMGLALSPDGGTLVSVGTSGAVMLWNLETREQIGPTLEHDAWVYCVAFSPDGSLVASGGGRAQARLWNASGSGALVAELPGGSRRTWAFVSGLAFGPDGATLAVSRTTGDVTLWNVSSLGTDSDLAAYTEVIRLDEASGAVDWNLRARTLGPSTVTKRFVEGDSLCFAFLREGEAARDQHEQLVSYYMSLGNFRAAHAALASLRDPAASAEQWVALVEAMVAEASSRRARGDSAAARLLIALASKLAEEHSISPQGEVGPTRAGTSASPR